MYMYGWVPLLFTWSYHNTVNYTPTQNKKLKKFKKDFEKKKKEIQV